MRRSRTLITEVVALFIALAACQSPREGGSVGRDPARPLQPLTPVELVEEMERLVRDRVTRPEPARTLLDRLDQIKGLLRLGETRGARPVIFGLVQAIEALAGRGDLPPADANALLLRAGTTLGGIGVEPLCEARPGPSGRPPYFIYFSKACVARLDSNPADPATPLAPDAREHCNPVTVALQLDLVSQALAMCEADPYTCTPASPATCPEGCAKDARPGYSVPTVSFIPNSPECQDEPVRTHLCRAIGAYECTCSCPARESN
jgi:hypothetical protein